MDATQTTAKLLTNRVLGAIAPEIKTIKGNLAALSRAVDGLTVAHAGVAADFNAKITAIETAILAMGGEMAALQTAVETLLNAAPAAPEPSKEERKARMVQRFGNKLHEPYGAGEQHPAAKLTEAQVLEILALRANGFKGQEIADAFGISPSNVYLIASGRGWKHLPRPTMNGQTNG